MLLAAAVALVALSVPPAGGRLARLAELRLRRPWLLLAGLALQALVSPLGPDALGRGAAGAVYAASFVPLGAFVVANRRVPGLALVGLGGAANFTAIALNGGVMPASASALATAGLAARPSDGSFLNSVHVPEARVPFLGDVFALPASWPLANVFSLGDVAIVVGAAVLLHRVGDSRLATGTRGRGGHPSPDRRRRAAGRGTAGERAAARGPTGVAEDRAGGGGWGAGTRTLASGTKTRRPAS